MMTTDFLPHYSTPDRNRRVLLTERPQGIPQASQFVIDEAILPVVEAGHFLVRNIFLSVDPAQRGWVNESKNYSDPVPIGSVMRALSVGVIVESAHADFPVGLCLYGWFGWQDYALATPDKVMTRIDTLEAPLSAYAGVLGMTGLTAWLSFMKLGRPVEGDTVLVSTAAGSVGSVVGQLAKAQGCRVVGLAGDDEKIALCRNRFGYDDAANYRSGALWDLVTALAPDGLDIYFDNVGGPTLDAAIRAMRIGGRIVQCGTASIANWVPTPQGARNERDVLMRRLSWNGFVIFDHEADYPKALSALADMIRAGTLRYEEDIATSMNAAPDALRRLYAGENKGKQLIFVG